MNFILADQQPKDFYPLTLTRPVSLLRTGITTIHEKWEKALKSKVCNWSESHLQNKYPLSIELDNILIDSALLPNQSLIKQLQKLLNNQALVFQGRCFAFRLDAVELKSKKSPFKIGDLVNAHTKLIELEKAPLYLKKLTDLFTNNDQFIRDDFAELAKGKKNGKLAEKCTVIGKDLFIKAGAKISAAVLNTSTGPIYIDKDAEVMEGCLLRGPLYIGKGAVIKMGAKIYGPTTIGPECRVGGEVSNSVMLGYSNKGHDGFMGNSILGEWCNLGADTNTSNLKNNYGEVKIWSYEVNKLVDSGLQFCGLIMGDHSKSAINTQFNTGTTVGVMANVFKAGFPDKFIPSFSWLGDSVNEKYDLIKGIEVAKAVMSRRHVDLTEADISILEYISKNGNY